MKKIKVMVFDGSKKGKAKFRKAFCIGKFLACTAGKEPKEWNVTHIATGYKIYGGYIPFRLAVKLCKEFEAWGAEYWDFFDPEKIPKKLLDRKTEIRDEIEKAMKAVKGGKDD